MTDTPQAIRAALGEVLADPLARRLMWLSCRVRHEMTPDQLLKLWNAVQGVADAFGVKAEALVDAAGALQEDERP